MSKIKNSKGNLIIFSGLFLVVILLIWYQFKKGKDLKRNGVIVTATIKGILTGSKAPSTFEYKFSYKGIEYIDNNNAGIRTKNLFIGKTFPAIFSPVTENSQLLLTPEGFNEYGLKFPDSLNWVLEYKY